MPGNIIVSAIISCCKQAEHLPEAIQSIASQTITAWECIIINDGPLGSIRDIALQLMATEPRIRYYECSDIGLSAIRNYGIDESQGRYIQFLDADDLIAPNKWEIQSNIMSTINKLGLAYGDYYYCKKDGTLCDGLTCSVPHGFDSRDPLQDMAFKWKSELRMPLNCFLFDSRIFKEYEIRFDENVSEHEDWDCWMNIVALKPVLFFQNSKLAACRCHEGFISQSQKCMLDGFLKAARKPPKLVEHDRELVDI